MQTLAGPAKILEINTAVGHFKSKNAQILLVFGLPIRQSKKGENHRSPS